MWDASAKFKYRNAHYKNSEEKKTFYIGLKINFLLIQPRCQIYKMLFSESISSSEHSPVDKLLQTVTSQAEALQNSEIEIKLIPYL